MKESKYLLVLTILLLTACGRESVVSPVMGTATASNESPTPETVTDTLTGTLPSFDFSKELEPVAVEGSYQFAEGPAIDQDGNVYFSDITAGRIYKWSAYGTVTVFLEGLNLPNGLMFDGNGNLIACEGGNGRLISIDPRGRITVLVDQYEGIRFNEPNDLWIDPQGGIYFTDPSYQSPVVQDGEHVYYLSPDHSQVTRVINDMIKPNGIVGTTDGKILYVSDHGAGQIFVYDINSDNSLTNKRLFASVGSDGMDLDPSGNVYLTNPGQVQIFDNLGNLITSIPIPENPTNIVFGGKDRQTLFITARTAVYTIQMSFVGSESSGEPDSNTGSDVFILTSPVVMEGGALPAEYTCDGSSSSPALAWSGAPVGTTGYAVIMHHVANPQDIHWYWVLYNLPADVTSLPMNSIGIGTAGTNSVNGRLEYAPPCSKGPGEKIYSITVYALSSLPKFSVPASEVERATLLEAIQDITLASAELNVTYTRP